MHSMSLAFLLVLLSITCCSSRLTHGSSGQAVDTCFELACGRCPLTAPANPLHDRFTESRPHSMPWVVAIQQAGSSEPLCVGAIISPFWVITAANCVNRETFEAAGRTGLVVRAGLVDLDEDGSGQTREVSRVETHPGYNTYTHLSALSLLRLSQPLDLDVSPTGGHVSPACLPLKAPHVEQQCLVVGWPTELDPALFDAGLLHEMYVHVQDEDECEKKISQMKLKQKFDWGGHPQIDGLLCTYDPDLYCEDGGPDCGPEWRISGKRQCDRTLGSLLLCPNDARIGTWMLTGLRVAGEGCLDPDNGAAPGWPGMYVSVHDGIDWINGHMQDINENTLEETDAKKRTYEQTLLEIWADRLKRTSCLMEQEQDVVMLKRAIEKLIGDLVIVNWRVAYPNQVLPGMTADPQAGMGATWVIPEPVGDTQPQPVDTTWLLVEDQSSTYRTYQWNMEREVWDLMVEFSRPHSIAYSDELTKLLWQGTDYFVHKYDDSKTYVFNLQSEVIAGPAGATFDELEPEAVYDHDGRLVYLDKERIIYSSVVMVDATTPKVEVEVYNHHYKDGNNLEFIKMLHAPPGKQLKSDRVSVCKRELTDSPYGWFALVDPGSKSLSMYNSDMDWYSSASIEKEPLLANAIACLPEYIVVTGADWLATYSWDGRLVHTTSPENYQALFNDNIIIGVTAIFNPDFSIQVYTSSPNSATSTLHYLSPLAD